MPGSLFSRRAFSRTALQSFAAAFALPRLRDQENFRHNLPSGDGFIRISFNENNYGPSPKATQALDACGPIANRYPFVSEMGMTQALADYHGVKPENVILGCGSTEILRIADEAYLAPDKNLVVAEPTFEAVLEYAGIEHADSIKIPLTADHRHDLHRMAEACTSKTGLVYVCNPNNPTATIVSRDDMAEFINRVPRTTLILVDEAYFDFVDDARYASILPLIPSHPNLVMARTFSKIFGMAGMRLGYAVGAPETLAPMRKLLVQDSANAAVLSAGLASLQDRDYIADCRGKFIATRKWLAGELTKDGRNFTDSQANFLMIDVGTDVTPVIKQFTDNKILIGRRFPSMSTWIRVSIGKQAEMETFVAALREIVPAKGTRAA